MLRDCKNNCNSSDAKSIPATGHDWGEWKVKTPATGDQPGVKVRKCKVCGVTEEDEISEHNYGEWTVVKKATCTEEGTKQRTCADCGDVQTRSIPATGHEYVEERVKDTTCTENGLWKFTCTKCGDTYTKVEPATGHYFQGWDVLEKATCTEPGLKERVCCNWNTDGTHCDYKETREIPAIGHDWGNWVVTKEATCKEAGEKTRTCSVCDKTETQSIPKIDHEYKEQTEQKKVVDKKAWDEEVKTTIYFCTGCGAEFKTSGELGKHIDDASAGKIDGHPGYGSMSDRVETKIVHHNEEFHYETVTKHVCKVCGHVKED